MGKTNKMTNFFQDLTAASLPSFLLSANKRNTKMQMMSRNTQNLSKPTKAMYTDYLSQGTTA